MILSSIHGKLALVTAGTQGIGRAIVDHFLEIGLDVVTFGRNLDELHKLTQHWAIQRNKGASNHLYTICVDHNDTEQMQEKLNSFIQAKQGIDIMVHITGGPKPGPLAQAKVEDLTNTFAQHIGSAHILTQQIIPHMKKNHWGRIITVISTSVKTPLPMLGVSNTIRGAMASWTKTMANELGEFGITVNGILPGYIETNRLKEIIKDKAIKGNTSVEHMETVLKDQIPAKRFGTPAELAYMVGFLVGPQASYVNGTFVCVDGGRTPNI